MGERFFYDSTWDNAKRWLSSLRLDTSSVRSAVNPLDSVTLISRTEKTGLFKVAVRMRIWLIS